MSTFTSPRATSDQYVNVVNMLNVITLNGWATMDSGDVEAPSGWFALILNDRNGRDDESLVDAFETDLVEHGVSVEELRGAWVLTIDNYGFKDATEYSTENAARTAYDFLDREYGKWLDQGEDD